MDFYLDYLSANNAGLFLPTSIKSYLDGLLDQLEGRMSSLLYKQAVEQDLVAGILADAYQFSGEELRRRRTESVQNVRKTNGCISLEQRVRETWEDRVTSRQRFRQAQLPAVRAVSRGSGIRRSDITNKDFHQR